MSIADIIQAAIERCSRMNDRQQQSVADTQREFAANLGKPWKFKAESLREAMTPKEDEPTEGTP